MSIMRHVHTFNAIITKGAMPILTMPAGYIPLREGHTMSHHNDGVKVWVLAIYVGKKKAKSITAFPLTWEEIKAHPDCPRLGLALPLSAVHELLAE